MRISTVAFLNAAPLFWGLRKGRRPEGWYVSYDTPSVCARKLQAGRVDIGLVPSITLARNPALRRAADLCVAARDEAASVLLFPGGAEERIGTVFLDPASRTSQVLAQILLEDRPGAPLRFEESAPAVEGLRPDEAALVIGDRALRLAHGWNGIKPIDLAHRWRERTGLPFVFAVWAGTDPGCREEAAPVLAESYRYGRDRHDEIVAAFEHDLPLPRPILHDYLGRILHYELGEGEERSLDLFFREARERGLLNQSAGPEAGEGS